MQVYVKSWRTVGNGVLTSMCQCECVEVDVDMVCVGVSVWVCPCGCVQTGDHAHTVDGRHIHWSGIQPCMYVLCLFTLTSHGLEALATVEFNESYHIWKLSWPVSSPADL